MKKLLLLTTSPTVGGNGDALMQAAAEVGIPAKIRLLIWIEPVSSLTGSVNDLEGTDNHEQFYF